MLNMNKKQERLEQLHKHLNQEFAAKNFVLADGYIFSEFIKRIHFELFVDYEKIGLKYPKPNLSESKINQLSSIIFELDSRFKQRNYNTTLKNKYSIWEIDIKGFSENEIEKFIKKIEKIYT